MLIWTARIIVAELFKFTCSDMNGQLTSLLSIHNTTVTDCIVNIGYVVDKHLVVFYDVYIGFRQIG